MTGKGHEMRNLLSGSCGSYSWTGVTFSCRLNKGLECHRRKPTSDHRKPMRNNPNLSFSPLELFSALIYSLAKKGSRTPQIYILICAPGRVHLVFPVWINTLRLVVSPPTYEPAQHHLKGWLAAKWRADRADRSGPKKNIWTSLKQIGAAEERGDNEGKESDRDGKDAGQRPGKVAFRLCCMTPRNDDVHLTENPEEALRFMRSDARTGCKSPARPFPFCFFTNAQRWFARVNALVFHFTCPSVPATDGRGGGVGNFCLCVTADVLVSSSRPCEASEGRGNLLSQQGPINILLHVKLDAGYITLAVLGGDVCEYLITCGALPGHTHDF